MNHEKFRELHDYCQTLTPKIKRNHIIKKIKEVSGKEKLRVLKTTLDTKVTRGFFLSASNTEHPFVKENGFDVIVLARGLNECWERFVNVKEAMHLLDSDEDNTDTPEKLEQLLNDLSAPPPEISNLGISDHMGVWMALACFCPEKNRQEFIHLRGENKIDNYGVALKLKIPELYVPMLFMPRYPDLIKAIRGE